MTVVVELAIIGALAVTSVAKTIRGGINDRRNARAKALAGPEPVCGCKHHLSFHDAQTGQCHEFVMVKVPGQEHKERVGCSCRRYVGPEPLGGYFVPEITS
jgi:hypothetical protein